MRPRSKRFGWWVRIGLLVATFLTALLAFRLGVGVTDREGLETADVFTQTYYALGLFVLGGLDLGLPNGGPLGARIALWVAYFVAPLITTSAVVEGALRLLRPGNLARLALRDHIVVIGIGRLGMLFLETLHEKMPDARVLVVDRDRHRANATLVSSQFGASFMAGDIRHNAVLDALMLHRARAVALMTDDDLVNLEAAWQIAERVPSLDVIAHVADIGMRRMVSKLSGDDNSNVHIFNSHQIAAQRLYEQHLERHFHETAQEDIVVIAGFGRFGQTILEYLQRAAKGEVQRAIVVDSSAERLVRLFRAQVPGFESCELVTIEGNLDDPKTWKAVESASSGFGVEPVYIVGTDNDQVNLRTAISLRSLHPNAALFVRCVYESAFSTQLSEELRFEVLAVEGMLREALVVRHGNWLGKR